MSDEKQRTTTDSGIPATSDEFSLTVGPSGPIALHDHYVVQKMQHFNRERVPERVVHAKGGAAHGVFEVTEDVTPVHQGRLPRSVGKTHRHLPALLHGGRRAGLRRHRPRPPRLRDQVLHRRGQLRHGRQQHAGLLRARPVEVPGLHPLPEAPARARGMHSHDMQWDFWTLSPESAHQVTILMSDRGIPATWRHQHGFSSHTYSWVNAGGERFWVKYHFRTDQGIENLPDGRRRPPGRRGPRLPPARPGHRDRDGRPPLVDALGPGDAVRGGGRLPLQPVRPDQGLAQGRLPADPGRPAHAQPQPGELLRRGGAGQRSSPRTWCRHRPVARTRC